MSAEQVNKARKLFEKQANALVSCGMPRVDVNKPLARQTVAGMSVNSMAREPILGEGEDEDPENYEAIFEQNYVGKMPEAIVGLMFDSKTVTAYDGNNNSVEVALWEKVLMGLSKRLISDGVESTRQLYNIEKAERRAAGNDASSCPMSDEDED